MKKTILILLALIMAAPAMAQSYSQGDITVEGTFIQEGPPRAVTLGGFATIRNTGTQPDRLVGMESAAVDSIDLFEATVSDGIARMVPLPDGVEVPAGATVELGAIGNHPMFSGPKRPLRAGDTVPVTLVFARAGRINTEFLIDRMLPGQTRVNAPATMRGMGAMDGMEMGTGAPANGQ